MLDEEGRKEVVQEYFRRLNAGDIDGVVALFSEDGKVEDPLGYEPRKGGRALRDYYHLNIVECKVQDTVEKVVAAQDGRSVAASVVCDAINFMDPQKNRVHINAILTFQVNEDGLIDELRSFWCFKDLAAA